MEASERREARDFTGADCVCRRTQEGGEEGRPERMYEESILDTLIKLARSGLSITLSYLFTSCV